MSSRAKIFQIGFNKCATRSISVFFKRNGFRTADWERGELAKSIKAAVDKGGRMLSDWDDINVFSDMEFVSSRELIEGYRYFREIHHHYPSAQFILNTRNVEEWIVSRHKHGSGSYTNAYRRYYGYGTDEEVF